MGKTIRLHKKLTPKYKYNINEQLGLLPRELKIQKVLQHLKLNGISHHQFYADRAIEYGSDKSIPSDRLLIYTKVFDCSIEDMMNHTIKAQSLRELNAPVKFKGSLK